MSFYSSNIQKLIDEFAKFPGIGKKTAERFIFYLINKNQMSLDLIAELIKNLKNEVQICPICFNISSQTTCSICDNSERSQGVICIVEKPQDLQAIENTGEYQGVYHVLGGKIDTLEPDTFKNLKIRELFERIKKNNPKIHEIIFGINSDIGGESTIIYLTNMIKKIDPLIKISRLAQGLPTGSDIEYADQITISNALKNRRKI
ncbi:MAG: recombination mediator RecR [Patescibacteria group bacterium]